MRARAVETLTDQAFTGAPTANDALQCLVRFHDSPQKSLRLPAFLRRPAERQQPLIQTTPGINPGKIHAKKPDTLRLNKT